VTFGRPERPGRSRTADR